MIRAALPCALAVLCGCLPSSNIDGLEFACDSGVTCQEGFRCWRGVCTQDAGWNLGTPCMADDDCANGICSDGVCCVRRCEGACEACDQGLPGACAPLPAGDPGSPSCSPYFCDGFSNVCPGSCTGDPDCLTGSYCDAGNCTALQPQGDRCIRGGTCASTFCVDGRCCDSACGNPCDACDVPTRLGQCSTSPLGRVPSTSCGLFACNGTSVNCPTICTSDAGCLAGLSCSFFRQCQSKVETLYEPFDGTTLDAGTWATYVDPGTSLAVNNRLETMTAPLSGSAYVGVFSNPTFDATNSRISAQLVLPGDQSLATYETYFEYVSTDNQNRFGFDINQNQIYAQEQRNGTYQPAVSIPYNPNLHRFFRLRLDGGVAIWEWSFDAGSYFVLDTTNTRTWMQTVYVELGSGSWAPEDGGTLSAWDNVRK